MNLPSFRTPLLTAAFALLLLPSLAEAARTAPDKAVLRGLHGLVAAPGGPPGAIATIHRGGRTTVLSAGRSDVGSPGRPRATDHMRIASVAKAFSGAVALNLVRKRRLRLGDSIGRRLPNLPPAWHPVTIRQLLNHTSGLPDYTLSAGFAEHARTNPRGFLHPSTIIDWVSAHVSCSHPARSTSTRTPTTSSSR
jgi:D-alanyl-D-alanine carboxypeptidase